MVYEGTLDTLVKKKIVTVTVTIIIYHLKLRLKKTKFFLIEKKCKIIFKIQFDS